MITGVSATPARLREQSPTSPVHVFAVHTLPIHIGPLGAPPPTPHLWLRFRKVPAEGAATPPSRAGAERLWSQEPPPSH